MPKRIDSSVCISCCSCEGVCIVGCISMDIDSIMFINESACVDCGACSYVCPMNAINNL